MKEKNNKAKVGTLLSGVVLGLLMAVVVLVIVCIVFMRTNPAAPVEGAMQTQPVEETVADATEAATDSQQEELAQPLLEMAIETPYCTLYYPGKWVDVVKTEAVDLGYGYQVQFYGVDGKKEINLFSVQFGAEDTSAEPVGSVLKNDIATEVFLEKAKLPANASENIVAMHNDADYLLNKLKENMFFVVAEPVGEISVPNLSDAPIETPFCTLYYPGEWKDAVKWEVSSSADQCNVSFAETFSGKNVNVFTIGFNDGSDKGFQMGKLKYQGKDIVVSLVLSDFPQEGSWSDSEKALFITLQEQAFTMLEKLAENFEYTSVLAME